MRATRSMWTALAILAIAGCGGPEHSTGDSDDLGIVQTDRIGGDEIEPAVRELCDKISSKSAQGWPGHVLLSDDLQLPVVRIAAIQNRTPHYFDLVILRNELTHALTTQEAVSVGALYTDLDAIHIAQEYSRSGQTSEEIPVGQADPVGLVLVGEITDEVVRQGDIKQHDYYFHLRLVDTVGSRVVLTSRTKIRKIREG
jgi:Peptidoglycan-synthase activator LpoB